MKLAMALWLNAFGRINDDRPQAAAFDEPQLREGSGRSSAASRKDSRVGGRKIVAPDAAALNEGLDLQRNGLPAPLLKRQTPPRIPCKAAAFITCPTPRSMAARDAIGWLQRRADILRAVEPVEDITVRELRPRGRDPVWLMHIVLGSDEDRDWEQQLLGDLVGDLRRLGTRPTVCIDERSTEAATGFSVPPDRPRPTAHSAHPEQRPASQARTSDDPNPPPRRMAGYATPRRTHDLVLSIPIGLTASQLDRELALGADPAADSLLERRAFQLASPPAHHGSLAGPKAPSRRADPLPKGMTCAESRLGKQGEKEPSSWLHIAARVLAVAGYHAGLVQPYRRD
jgi:hypothetical protein